MTPTLIRKRAMEMAKMPKMGIKMKVIKVSVLHLSEDADFRFRKDSKKTRL